MGGTEPGREDVNDDVNDDDDDDDADVVEEDMAFMSFGLALEDTIVINCDKRLAELKDERGATGRLERNKSVGRCESA